MALPELRAEATVDPRQWLASASRKSENAQAVITDYRVTVSLLENRARRTRTANEHGRVVA